MFLASTFLKFPLLPCATTSNSKDTRDQKNTTSTELNSESTERDQTQSITTLTTQSRDSDSRLKSMAEPPPSSSLAELVVSLEQATMAAKQLPSTAEPFHILQIHNSLHHAHNHLSAFLSRPQFPLPLLPPPPENSLSSSAADPMQLGDDSEDKNEKDDDVDQVDSRGVVDGVEEKMRNCFIKNKRRKRRASPEEKRFGDDGFRPVADGLRFDPYATRLRALELVYQFHG